MISEQNQYEGAIDVSVGVAHPSFMQSRDERTTIERKLVPVLDDDVSVRESLPDLLRVFGFTARAFSSAKEFLSSGCIDETGCLILDIFMPGMSGQELQQELKRLGRNIPIIFITGRKDEMVRAQVLEQGAAGFLMKPFSDTDLLAAIQTALQVT